MTQRIFIDGEAGTTGLQIRTRLAARRDLEILSIPEADRKDARVRAEFLNQADLVILCLPDDAAREAVSLIDNDKVRVIDTSTAHRVHPDWAYGFPEMTADQSAEIAQATRVSNPGCYPTGAIALIRPLVSAGLLPADTPMSISAVSGYSGGGRKLIERFEQPDGTEAIEDAYYLYALAGTHKHLPEMQAHCGLAQAPIFMPSVARYRQGMLVQVPLHLSTLSCPTSLADLQGLLSAYYAGKTYVEVADLTDCQSLDRLDPEGLNGSNMLRLHVFGQEGSGQAVLVALLDNLGKGASGAAVQNLNLMLGCAETAGLEVGLAA